MGDTVDWSQLLAPPGDYLVIAMGILMLLGLAALLEQIMGFIWSMAKRIAAFGTKRKASTAHWP